MGTMCFKMEISESLHKTIRERSRRSKKTINIFKWRVKLEGFGYISMPGEEKRDNKL